MRRFWPRLLKSVLPVTLLCGAVGYLYAVAAGAYVATEHDDGGGLRDTLTWRVPFFMALWGGGFTLLVEWFRHLWAPAKKGEKPAAATPSPDAVAEKLLLQLLEQAEQAEQSRAIPMPTTRTLPADLTDTPPPDFPPAPVPDALEQRA